MHYQALIENRKSVRAFREKDVPEGDINDIRRFYDRTCHRLLEDLPTELIILGPGDRAALEGSAGYEDFLIGAPHYLVLLSAEHPHMAENAGYMMEDLILKLEDLNLNSCWLTFADGEKVKKALGLKSPLMVAAVAAFGFGEKRSKKLHFNILSMSNVDISSRDAYYAPKKNIGSLLSLEELGDAANLHDFFGSYDDVLWQSFYAVTQCPSYLNRQPYNFLLKDRDLYLIRMPDDYTDAYNEGLNLGIAMLHFIVVAQQWMGKLQWNLNPEAELSLPEGCAVSAVCRR